jgi:hypothetical protein
LLVSWAVPSFSTGQVRVAAPRVKDNVVTLPIPASLAPGAIYEGRFYGGFRGLLFGILQLDLLANLFGLTVDVQVNTQSGFQCRTNVIVGN